MDTNIGFLSGYYFPEHKHKHYEIIIYIEGTGFFKTENSQIPFSPGTIIIIPPNTLHCSVSENRFERIYISGKLDWIMSVPNAVSLSNGKNDDGVLLAKLIYQNKYKNSDYLASLINAFGTYILQSMKIDDKTDAAINAITKEISERFFDCNINLSSILKNSGYAEDYIRDKFKKATGKTPVRFLTEIRISHSCLLIDFYKNSLPLSEIAGKCGYTDYVYFSRRFKEIIGVSPREYIHSR